MAKSKRKKGKQNNFLVAGTILIWVTVLLVAVGMAAGAAAGGVNAEDFAFLFGGGDVSLPTLQPPTVVIEQESTPIEPSFAWEGLVSTPVGEVNHNPEEATGLESVPAPELSLTPTPHFSLPPTTFSEGPILIGYSVMGRPLEVFRFGNGPVKRMIVAGIHGGYEGNTVMLADALIEHIQTHPEIIPPTVTLYLLRNLNPDGYARAEGVDGRANENNVDLNRNFPVNWEAEWSRSGCWSYRKLTAGSEPGSEPETQALMAFVTDVRPTAIISYHSAALGIFPGGEPADPESVQLAEALAEASTYPYPPINTGCFYTGTLPDWAVSMGIAAVDLELHTHKYTDFEESLDVLEAFLMWRR